MLQIRKARCVFRKRVSCRVNKPRVLRSCYIIRRNFNSLIFPTCLYNISRAIQSTKETRPPTKVYKGTSYVQNERILSFSLRGKTTLVSSSSNTKASGAISKLQQLRVYIANRKKKDSLALVRVSYRDDRRRLSTGDNRC